MQKISRICSRNVPPRYSSNYVRTAVLPALAGDYGHTLTHLVLIELAAAPKDVKRMNYENFGSITKRLRIVYQTWPVTFITPAKLSVAEVHTFHELLHSEDPPVLYRKVTKTEWDLYHARLIESGSAADLPPQPPPPNVPVPTVLTIPTEAQSAASRLMQNPAAPSTSYQQGHVSPCLYYRRNGEVAVMQKRYSREQSNPT